jgi:poly(A) polymerase
MENKKKQAALAVVRHLANNGYQALYAGGCVRDMLLGGIPGDIDIATNATPETVTSLFEQVIGVGEHFGVMIVVVDGIPFEVATFRSDIGSADGRHPGSVVFVDAQHDAMRRDFTINGMFYDPLTEQLFDYVGGRADLEKKIIRAIGNPVLRFEEDYLRLLRAVRFSARFGFPIEPDTWNALQQHASGISHVSAERILQEFDKMLTGPNPQTAVSMLHESGLLALILPEVEATIGVEQPPEFHPEGDVFVHTLLALSLLKNPSRFVAWSTLLHDIGKPATKTISDRIRFSNHQRIGAVMAKKVLLRLKAPNSLIDGVYGCIDNHMNFMNVKNMRLSTLKRFLSRTTFEDEMELHRVDCLSSHGGLDNYDFLRQKQLEIPVNEVKPNPLLTGKDLIALGFIPGPVFKTVLGEAYDLQLEGKITTMEEAIEWAQGKKD